MSKLNRATAEQIAGWKKKHGNVFEIVVEDKICYLKEPDLNILSAASVVGQKSPFEYNKTILTNCWLGGDEEIKTEQAYFLGISGKIQEIVDIKEAEVKKL